MTTSHFTILSASWEATMSGLSIGKLAQVTQVGIDTIRFYEKRGLLQPARRPSGFREYSRSDVMRLLFVRRARALGFSLEEIAELLLLESEPERAALESVVETQLSTIGQKIDELKTWRNALLNWQRLAGEPAEATPTLVEAVIALSDKAPPSCVSGCDCADPRTC